MLLLWLKAFHLVAVVAWFAGIFYLPRLFVYHAMALEEGDQRGVERFKVMERKLYNGIMKPSAGLALLLGLAMLYVHGLTFLTMSHWLHAKLLLVALLIGYQIWLASFLTAFARDENTRSQRFFRVINELPVLLLVGIVVLVIVKSF